MVPIMRTYAILYVVATLTQSIDAARILAVHPFPAYSHYQLGDKIYKELASRGHDVTVISPFREKMETKNFKTILVDDLIEKAIEIKSALYEQVDYNTLTKVIWMDTLGLNFTELALNSTNVRTFLQEKNHFDVVIIQHFMSDAYHGFCHHFNAPCIAVSPMTSPNWINKKVGNSAPPSYIPQLLLNYSSDMNFMQRFFNTIGYILYELSHHLYLYPNHNKLMQKYFPGAPHLDSLYYNTSLVLINSHVSVNDASPVLPNTIEIAGYHVSSPKKLPADLQEYLDAATDGVIYFSMGSNLKSKDFTPAKLSGVLNVFSQLKQKVVWKWENNTLKNCPDNVSIRQWLPQQDILAHHNVVLFITHGGLLSMIEAVYHGIPLLGLPVFTDQFYNMANAEHAGYGKFIPYGDLSQENFGKAINELLTNPKYAKTAKARSNIMHDQPLKPLDRAIFWIEYVIRHQGAPHLKSAALNLSWYQYFLLDILFVVIICIAIVIVVIRKVLLQLNQLYRFLIIIKKKNR